MEETNELALAVSADAYNPEDPRSLQQVLDPNSNLPERITKLATEINIGRTDDAWKRILKDHKDYKLARRLRLQFWNFYNMAIAYKNPKTIPVTQLHSGICSRMVYDRIIGDDKLASFVFTQPHKVRLIQEDLLYEGYKALEEIMEMPIYKNDGTVDPRIVGHKLKVIQMLEDRINGSVVQRTQTYIEQTSKFEGNKTESEEDIIKLKEQIRNMKVNLNKDVEDAEYTEVK